MDRTVPNSGNNDIALYIRTYYSLLRSSRAVNIRTLVESHKGMQSALHVSAESSQPDMAAFIYAVLRLPPQIISKVTQVVLGQSDRAFIEHGFGNPEQWQTVGTPARRRRTFYDGNETLAVYIASRSDIDDLIPMLTAFQIERDKMHRLFGQPSVLQLLAMHGSGVFDAVMMQELAQLTGVDVEDLQRLQTIWRDETAEKLLGIGRKKVTYSVRSLAGSLADYRRATRAWWEHVEESLPEIVFEDRPVYFVSSNTHSISNLLCGFALQKEAELVEYIESSGNSSLQQEYADILASNVPSSRENFLYYVLKKYEQSEPSVLAERLEQERQLGIYRVSSEHLFDIEVQIFDLSKIDAEWLDPRLNRPQLELLKASKALVVNIDFPLGMAAYQVLSEIAHNIAGIRGVYIMGKAATLNGQIGDVMIPSVVHDEHSQNTYLFHNCISAEDVVPHLVYGNILDNQKAITVLGTFLQNHDHMSVFYQEGYADMEMEAGPYLSSVYEMFRPKRYPTNEIVHMHGMPFPIGIVHYASDTPLSKGKNLGSQNLSYFGVDATYATSVAVLDNILREEIRFQGNRGS